MNASKSVLLRLRTPNPGRAEDAIEASIDARIDACFVNHRGRGMRTTLNIDDELLARATKLAGPIERSALIREALIALIERESARRLARLGGMQPALKPAPRRRGNR